jgi:hypothetical protein
MAPAATPVTLRTLLTQARILFVHQAIVANGGNVTHAARELGVTRGAVYRNTCATCGGPVVLCSCGASVCYCNLLGHAGCS